LINKFGVTESTVVVNAKVLVRV